MKKKVVVVLVVIGLLFFISNKSKEDIVIIYSSAEQFRNEELIEQLNTKLSHINTKVMYIPTGKAAAKVALEGERTEADIVLALETGYLNKISENLEDLTGLSRIPYVDEFKMKEKDNKYVIWERQAGTFVYNTEVLDKMNLEAPKTYEDLLKPEYKGLIAMPDPKSSGTGYFFLKSLVNTWGEEEGFAYFDKLESNVKQFTESGSGPIKLLNQGEVAIGLALTFQSIGEINDGRPFDTFFPEEGSPFSLTGTGLVKGRKDNEAVMEVLDFLINDFIMTDKEEFSPETIYENQINKIDNYPTGIHYADMDGIQDILEKERLLDKWKY